MSATWKPYPRYKDSGVQWLGRIPEHWEVKPLKRLGVVKGGNGFPDEEQGVENEELPFYKVSDMNLEGNGVVMCTHNNSVSRSTARRLGASIFLPDAIVFPKVGAALLTNKRRILSRAACIDNNTMAFTVSEGSVKFLFYRLVCIDLGRLANPGAVPSLNEKEAGEIAVGVPPGVEQQSIAFFLDRETGKIDALVAKKERLIELLQEKRTALISHAVTQGLNPNAPMKDSGIPWLGRIPAHWQVLKLKFIADGARGSFTDGDWIESPFITNEGIRLLQCGNVGTGLFEEQGFRYITEDTFRQFQCSEVFPGDILICRLRSSQNILAGRACVAPDLGRRMITSVDNCILRPSDEHDSSYLVYQMSLPEYLGFVEEIARGGTRDRISRSMLADFKFATPPRYEQAQIAGHLDHETSKLDALMAKVQAAIERLQEYRTALISAAVTGQIDVRSATMCARGGDAGGFEG